MKSTGPEMGRTGCVAGSQRKPRRREQARPGTWGRRRAAAAVSSGTFRTSLGSPHQRKAPELWLPGAPSHFRQA